MRHLVFLQAMERWQADSPEWADTATGYALLCMVDRWGFDSPDATTAAVASAIELGRPASQTTGVRVALASVGRLLELGPPTPVLQRRLASALLRYADQLVTAGHWLLAHDVSTAAIQLDKQNVGVYWRALRLRGRLNRMNGDLASAESDYRRCVRLGKRYKRIVPVAVGRIGLMKVFMSRGNLPLAERRARRLLRRCIQIGRRDLIAIAHHELGTILGMRKRIRASIEHLRRALVADTGRNRDRIVSDLALVLFAQGHVEAAKQLFEMLVASGKDPVPVIAAHTNLIELCGAVGERTQVEAHRAVLEARKLPPWLEMDFRLTLGKAYLALGDIALAEPQLRLAESLDSAGGFGRIVIEADVGLTKTSPARAPTNGSNTLTQTSATSAVQCAARTFARRVAT